MNTDERIAEILDAVNKAEHKTEHKENKSPNPKPTNEPKSTSFAHWEFNENENLNDFEAIIHLDPKSMLK